jgi:hypothetical protein
LPETEEVSYPREAEDARYACPKAAETPVVGTADPLMGEDELAFVGDALSKSPVGKSLRKALQGRA